VGQSGSKSVMNTKWLALLDVYETNLRYIFYAVKICLRNFHGANKEDNHSQQILIVPLHIGGLFEDRKVFISFAFHVMPDNQTSSSSWTSACWSVSLVSRTYRRQIWRWSRWMTQLVAESYKSQITTKVRKK